MTKRKDEPDVVPPVDHETDRHLLREPNDTENKPLAEKLGPESLVPFDEDDANPGELVSDAAKENAEARKDAGE